MRLRSARPPVTRLWPGSSSSLGAIAGLWRRRSVVSRASAAAQAGLARNFTAPTTATRLMVWQICQRTIPTCPTARRSSGRRCPAISAGQFSMLARPRRPWRIREHERAAQEEEAGRRNEPSLRNDEHWTCHPRIVSGADIGVTCRRQRSRSGSNDLVSRGSQARVPERQCRSPHRELRSHPEAPAGAYVLQAGSSFRPRS